MADEKFLSLEEIEQAPNVEFATVEVWGGKLRLGSISAGDMIEFAEATDGPSKRNAGLRLIIQSAVDKDGKRLCDMTNKEQVRKQLDLLRKKDAKTCNKIVDAVLELNGLSKKKQADAKNDSSEANTDASLIA